MLRLMPHRRDIGPKAETPNIISSRLARCDHRRRRQRLQRRQHPQPRRLPERDHPHPRRHQIRAPRLQKRESRVIFRDAGVRRGDADGDRIGDGGGEGGRGLRLPVADGQAKGAALREGFHLSFGARRGGGGEVGDRAGVVGGAISEAQQDRVIARRAVGQESCKPGLEACLIGDIAGVDRPFDAMRIGVGAGGEGGRQPGQQAEQVIDGRGFRRRLVPGRRRLRWCARWRRGCAPCRR